MKTLKPSVMKFNEFCFRFGFTECIANFDNKGKGNYKYNTHAVKSKDLNKALHEYKKYLKNPTPPDTFVCDLCDSSSEPFEIESVDGKSDQFVKGWNEAVGKFYGRGN
jgi:hypothetical protein